jgi:hypothetical protein
VYLFHLGKLPAGVVVVAQVLLVSHEDDGNVGAEVLHLRGPLLWDVLCVGGRWGRWLQENQVDRSDRQSEEQHYR